MGEAQAVGVPSIVGKFGSVVERVVDGVTGTIAETDQEFARAAVKLLTDEVLWREQHRAAIDQQRKWGWPEAAMAFENLIS